MQKAQNGPQPHGRQDSTSSQSVIHEDGSVLPSTQRKNSGASTLVTGTNGDADDDASVRAVKESPSQRSRQGSLGIADIPTIRISTESDGEREAAVMEVVRESEPRGESQEERKEEEGTNDENEDEDLTKMNGTTPVVHAPLEKPVQAAADNSSGAEDAAPAPATTADAFSFSNKRLCERWLDNLFMVLYEVHLVSSDFVTAS